MRFLEVVSATVAQTDHVPEHMHVKLVQWLGKIFRDETRTPVSTMELIECGLQLLPRACCPCEQRGDLTRTLSLVFVCLKTRIHNSIDADDSLELPWMDGLTVNRPFNNPNTFFHDVSPQTPPERLDRISLLYFAELQTFSRMNALSRQRALNVATDLNNTSNALAECADAELGQQIFRELIVTFRLPRLACPPRKSVFLERSASRYAEKHHANILNHAYRTAMQGPINVWEKGVMCENDDMSNMVRSSFLHEHARQEREVEERRATMAQTQSESGHDLSDWYLERACVMLSAIAVNVYSDASDARSRDAFGGMLELPFFQRTVELNSSDPRLLLHNDTWVCYTVSERGALEVHVKGQENALLIFERYVRNFEFRSRARMGWDEGESAKLKKILEQKKVLTILDYMKELFISCQDEGSFVLSEVLQEINVTFSSTYGVPQHESDGLKSPIDMKFLKKCIRRLFNCLSGDFKDGIALTRRRRSGVDLIVVNNKESLRAATVACSALRAQLLSINTKR